MIEIFCRDERYTYNVYHITRAFFPGSEVRQRVDRDAPVPIRVCMEDGSEIVIGSEERMGTEEKQNQKHLADIALYKAYRERTGREVSWGLLTGVRPTKIAMQALSGGMDRADVIRWFRKEYLVSREKAGLAADIAEREARILAPLDYQDGYSLYVGIPFCPSVCSYCSFSSGAIGEYSKEVDAYVDALCRELTFIGKVSEKKKLNTIYIGGGTPTTLTEPQLERLLTHIDQVFLQHGGREHLLEYTVEAGRPDSITEGKLDIIRRHRVTRISINPQTMQQKTLDLIGRNHSVEDIRTVFRMARDKGFDNINMDLIAGLPGERTEDMQDTLRQIQELAPDNLTVHSLAIKRAAKMGQDRHQQGSTGPEEPEAGDQAQVLSDMIAMAAVTAQEMGLVPYYLYRQKNIAGNFENVGYAKVDKAGIYNILIMEEMQSIVAAGAGASTKIVLKDPVLVPGSRNGRKTTLIRVENVKDIRGYIQRIDEMIERKGEWLWR